MKKEGSLEEIILHGIEDIPIDKSVNLSLKDFLLVYRIVEELRRFMHNEDHYPSMESIHKFFGDKNEGMYSILTELYLRKLDKYISKEIEEIIESNSLDSDLIPFYYIQKADSE